MLGFLVDLLGGALAGWMGEAVYWRTSRRRTAAAARAGRDAMFPGWVVGDRPYCRAPGGLLVMTQDALYHVVDRGMPITRHDVPTDRLEVVAVRPGTYADHKHMPDSWSVMECLDGAVQVRLACHETQMRYIEQAFMR